LKKRTSGAQKTPVNPDTAFVVHDGTFVNTLGPGDQKTLSADDLERIPCPVEKT